MDSFSEVRSCCAEAPSLNPGASWTGAPGRGLRRQLAETDAALQPVADIPCHEVALACQGLVERAAPCQVPQPVDVPLKSVLSILQALQPGGLHPSGQHSTTLESDVEVVRQRADVGEPSIAVLRATWATASKLEATICVRALAAVSPMLTAAHAACSPALASSSPAWPAARAVCRMASSVAWEAS